MVDDEIIHVGDGSNLKDPALIAFDLIAGTESYPGQRRLLLRIGSAGAADGEVNGELPVFNCEHLAHAQLRFCSADPALTQAELLQSGTFERTIGVAGWANDSTFELSHICLSFRPLVWVCAHWQLHL